MTATTIQATTKLEIINQMLLSVGENAVNQIGEGYSEGRNAERILDAVSKEVQSRGWWFNLEQSYPLTPNVQNEVKLPVTFLKIDFNNQQYVQRGQRVYDKSNFTYKIPHKITADIIRQLPIEDLPEVAKTFIKITAMKRYQEAAVGSPQLSQYHREELTKAYGEMISTDTENGNYNLGNNQELQAIFSRGTTSLDTSSMFLGVS